MLTRRCRFSCYANVLALRKITGKLPNSPPFPPVYSVYLSIEPLTILWHCHFPQFTSKDPPPPLYSAQHCSTSLLNSSFITSTLQCFIFIQHGGNTFDLEMLHPSFKELFLSCNWCLNFWNWNRTGQNRIRYWLSWKKKTKPLRYYSMLKIRVITNSRFTFGLGLEEAVWPLSSVEKGVRSEFKLLVTFNSLIVIIPF